MNLLLRSTGANIKITQFSDMIWEDRSGHCVKLYHMNSSVTACIVPSLESKLESFKGIS